MQTADATEPRTRSPFINGYARWILLLVLVLLAAYNVLRLLPSTVLYGARGAADFSIFYTGATIIKNGLGSHLYDLAVQAQFHSPFYRAHPLPYNHLAYELLIFVPFASMPFGQAFWLWNLVNLLLITWSSAIVSPYLRNLFRPTAVLVLFAVTAFYPTMTAFSQGQDSILLLAIFTATYTLLKSGKDLGAGLILALGLFKFPLVLPFAVPFLFRKQWAFVRGFMLGGLLVLAASIAITGFSGVSQYLRLIDLLARRPDVGYIAPGLMPNLRGFLSVAVPHSHAAQIVFAAVGAVALLGFSTWKLPAGKDIELDAWFALNLFVAEIASPHLYRHDLTALILAILLAWNAMLEKRQTRTAMPLFGFITLVMFATPIYEFVNDRSVTSYLFVLLMTAVISIGLVATTKGPRPET